MKRQLLTLLFALFVGSSFAANPEIKGLVFVASPDEVLARGRALGELVRLDDQVPIDVSRQPLLQDAAFVAAMARHIGAQLDSQFIATLTGEVNAHLIATRRGLALVTVPAQDATGGVVQVLVMQPRLGKLTIEGAQVFSEEFYRQAIRQQPGETIDQASLNEDLDWIKRSNPFRSAVLVAAPGRQPGETDLSVRVSEKSPWAVQLGADNTGTENTKRERVNFGVTWGNAFNLGHMASYSLAASPEFEHYVTHTIGYTMPLANRSLLSLSANRADFEAIMPVPLDSKGYSYGISANYDQPLPSRGGYEHGLSASFDFKESNSNVLFSSIPVFDNTTQIVQFGLAYRGTMNDAYGQTSFQAGVKYSPGGLSADNKDEPFDTSRALAKANYRYATATVERLTHLPANWTWTINARLQAASGNLLGSEQLAVAGTQGVRGFKEGRLYADRGVVLRNEIHAPAFPLSDFGQGQAYGFVDAARVSNVDRLPGERASTRIASLGLGLRTTLKDKLSLRIEFGSQRQSDLADRKTTQIHASLSYQF